MSAEAYIKERLEQYQGWYDGKAVKCKSRYLRMRGASVVLGAIVPVTVNVTFEGSDIVTTLLSLAVVILVALESVLHYREQWKNYRSTEQFLGHEKVRFRARVNEYAEISEEAARRLLVERCEAAIASENAATLNTMTLGNEVAASAEG